MLKDVNKALKKEIKKLHKGGTVAENYSTATPPRSNVDLKKYSENLDAIKKTVACQQKTLEDLQGDKRSKNIITVAFECLHLPHTLHPVCHQRKSLILLLSIVIHNETQLLVIFSFLTGQQIVLMPGTSGRW